MTLPANLLMDTVLKGQVAVVRGEFRQVVGGLGFICTVSWRNNCRHPVADDGIAFPISERGERKSRDNSIRRVLAEACNYLLRASIALKLIAEIEVLPGAHGNLIHAFRALAVDLRMNRNGCY